MSDLSDSEKIELAKYFITQYLRKLSEDPSKYIDAFEWKRRVLYYLVFYRKGKHSSLSFSKEELVNNYGSSKWKKRLREKILKFLAANEG
jgi:hypothetical protein